MARCTSFIYCVDIFCHAIFTAMGLLAIAVAIAGYVILLGSSKVDYGLKILEASPVMVLIPIAFFLVLGLVLVGIGVYGLFKARKIEETPKIMLILAIIIIVIVFIITSLILVCVFFVNDVETRLDKNMQETISVAANDASSSERKDWDNVQDAFECCGVTDGYDWLFQLNSLNWNDTYVPGSCGDSDAEKIDREGCKDTVQEDILAITVLCCGSLALGAGIMAVSAIMMLAVSIKSMRDPEWMRLKNEVKEDDDLDDDDASMSDYKTEQSVHDIQQMFQSQPVSARDVRLSRANSGLVPPSLNKVEPLPTPPKKANPVVVSKVK